MPDDAKRGRHVGRGRALCVAPHPEAAEVGAEMLRRGGNAFDAAVAAGFMEAVVEPGMCGIGGYGAVGIGFLAGQGRLVALDANTVAPAAATPGMFPTIPARDPNRYKLPDDRHKSGPLSVGVPGVLGGLLKVLETWGRLPRREVMEPAIRRAREGAVLPPAHARLWRSMSARADGEPAPARVSGATPIPMPRLAAVLEEVAAEGADAFYAGRIGRAIADHVRAQGGLLTREDMAAYRPLIVEPVAVEVRGHSVATPPPSSGGLSTLQIVALMDGLHRSGKGGEPGSSEELEAFLETIKVAWEERLTRFADPSAMDRPPAFYLTPGHLAGLRARIEDGLAHPGPGRLVAPDPLKGTAHLAAADAEGNLVSWTQTHGGTFGSGLMVPGTEIVLGHGMCRFEPRTGWPNSVAPGRRPLHNMAPVIAVEGGRAVLAAGASGGRTIVNNVAAMLIARLIHGRELPDAVAAPRLQCESVEPATIERAAGEVVIRSLRNRGHQVDPVAQDPGKAHLIARDRDGWSGAAETRSAGATVAPA